MNPKTTLFNALSALLKEKTTVKTVLFFNNQFEKEKSERPKLFPCVLVEFANLDYISKSESLQEGDTTIRLHVGLESLAEQEQKVLEVIDEIHFFLQNWSIADLTSPLDRKNERQDSDHDSLIVWQVEYNTLLSDNSANRRRKLVRMESIDNLDNSKETEPAYLTPSS